MGEGYYAIKQRLHPSESNLKGISLVLVSEGEITWKAGNTFVYRMTELKNNELKVKDTAVCQYDIYSLSQSQFTFYKAVLEGKTCGSGNTKTFADPETKTIFVGKIQWT